MTSVLKTAIIEDVIKTTSNCISKTVRTFKEIIWQKKHQKAFDTVKKAIIENACSGGQEDIQYHLSTDASKTGVGGLLFQLPDDHSLRQMKIPIDQ